MRLEFICGLHPVLEINLILPRVNLTAFNSSVLTNRGLVRAECDIKLAPIQAELNLLIRFCSPSQLYKFKLILRKLRLPSTLIEEISLELILGITSLKRSPILTRTSDIFLVAKFLRHDVKGLPKETIYHLSILFRDIIGTILID